MHKLVETIEKMDSEMFKTLFLNFLKEHESEMQSDLLKGLLNGFDLGMSSFGVPYGYPHPQYDGVVMDAGMFDEGTYFFVVNGHWRGYVDVDVDGNKVIYTGVSVKNSSPYENYVKKHVISKGETYDVVVYDGNMAEYVAFMRDEINLPYFKRTRLNLIETILKSKREKAC